MHIIYTKCPETVRVLFIKNAYFSKWRLTGDLDGAIITLVKKDKDLNNLKMRG